MLANINLSALTGVEFRFLEMVTHNSLLTRKGKGLANLFLSNTYFSLIPSSRTVSANSNIAVKSLRFTDSRNSRYSPGRLSTA